jgi:hypothetical protein
MVQERLEKLGKVDVGKRVGPQEEGGQLEVGCVCVPSVAHPPVPS